MLARVATFCVLVRARDPDHRSMHLDCTYNLLLPAAAASAWCAGLARGHEAKLEENGGRHSSRRLSCAGCQTLKWGEEQVTKKNCIDSHLLCGGLVLRTHATVSGGGHGTVISNAAAVRMHQANARHRGYTALSTPLDKFAWTVPACRLGPLDVALFLLKVLFGLLLAATCHYV